MGRSSHNTPSYQDWQFLPIGIEVRGLKRSHAPEHFLALCYSQSYCPVWAIKAMSAQPSLEAPSPPQAEVQIPWKPLLWLSVLLCVAYGPVLYYMITEWIIYEDMGHGLFVLPVALYVVWNERDQIFNRPVSPSWWGMLLLAWGFLQVVIGTLGADFFIARTSFLIAIVGLIWLFGGWRMVKQLRFPLFLLLFMIRIPTFIYSQITLPLQLFASQVATLSLSMLGIPVLREGNVLELASQKLSVVEACSGIRSLLSLGFLALVYAYFFDKRPWMRAVLLLAAVPIAIVANSSRITITGILSEIDPKLAEGAYHSIQGFVIFIVALVALVAAHKLISRVYRLIYERK